MTGRGLFFVRRRDFFRDAEQAGQHEAERHRPHRDQEVGEQLVRLVNVHQVGGQHRQPVGVGLDVQQREDRRPQARSEQHDDQGPQVIAELDAEQHGFADAEQLGEHGADAGLADALFLRFDEEGQAGAHVGKAVHGAEGDDGVEPGVRQQRGLDHRIGMVQAGDDQQRVRCADQEAADAEGQVDKAFDHVHKAQFHHVHDRPDAEDHDQEGDHHDDERRHDEVKGVGHDLAQLLFKAGADEGREDGGQDAALAAHHRDEAERHDGLHAAVGVGHRVGVGQDGGHQHQAQHQADDRRAAEHFEGGPADDRRQEGEGGLRQDVDQRDDVVWDHAGRSAEQPQHVVVEQAAFQAQEQAGGRDDRDDGDEDVAQGPHHPLDALLLLFDRFILFLFGEGVQAQAVQFRIDLVDDAGAQDDLVLPCVEESPLDEIHLFQPLGVDGVLVLDDQAQAGSAMGSGYDVVFAHDLDDLGRNAAIVLFCHDVQLLL